MVINIITITICPSPLFLVGINEKAIIDILTSRSSEQRVAIRSCYLEKYQKVGIKYNFCDTCCVYILHCIRLIFEFMCMQDLTHLNKKASTFCQSTP